MGIGRSWDRSPFTSGASGPVLPLDVVSGAVAAYSQRRLRTAYAGSALRVRRLADDVESDIGFNGNAFDSAAYSSFIGASSGLSVKGYDQTLTSDFIQSTKANQANIALDSSFYGPKTAGGLSVWLPAADTVANRDLFKGVGGGFAIAVVNMSTSGGVNAVFSKGTWVLYGFPGGGGEQLWWYYKGAGGDGFWGTNNLMPAGKHIVSVAFDASSPTVAPVTSIDGVACTFGTTSPVSGAATSDSGFNLELINNEVLSTNGNSMQDTMYEAIFFKGAVSASDQALLVADMKAAYGIA